MAFNVLTTPSGKSGLSCLHSACIEGDIGTVSAIFNCSPDKLDTAIATGVKILCNSAHFPGKSIYSVLREQGSVQHKQIRELLEKVAKHFHSQSLLHLAAKKGNTEHLRRLLDCGEYIDSLSPDLSGTRETPLMLAARFNDVEVVEYLIEKGAGLEMQNHMGFSPIHYAAMGGKTINILRLIELGADVLKESYEKESAIHLAVKNGHARAVQLLLEHGADAMTRNDLSFTPVMLAAQNGHLETIQVLLRNRGSVNVGAKNSRMLLHCAAEGDHTDVVKCILQNCGNVLAKTSENLTVLHLATSLELVKLLVEKGADIHAVERLGSTPLHAAAGKGQTDTVNYLLNQGADINSRSVAGYSALFCALNRGHAATAKALIERGCDLNLKNGEDPYKSAIPILLKNAVLNGQNDVLQIIVDILGVSVETVTSRRQTLLCEAAEVGKCDMITFLLDRGANINGTDNVDTDFWSWSEEEEGVLLGPIKAGRLSPLYCALKAGHAKAAKLLIERGADTSNLNHRCCSLQTLAARNGLFDILELLSGTDSIYFAKMDDGNTALTSAAGRGDVKSVQFLLQKGVDINAKNMSGDTALSCAIKGVSRLGVIEIVNLLLSSGADINAKNYNSETPLQIACEKNLDLVAETLLEQGCETNVGNIHSYSSLHYAARNNNGKLTKMLLQYGADASVKSDQDEVTPLHLAASNESVHAAKVLLSHAVNIEATNKLGQTPLAVAAARGSLPMTELLLRNGSNVQTKDRCGKTPLIHAAENSIKDQYESITRDLLMEGSCVNATDQYGRSCIHYGSRKATRDLLEFLLDCGACVHLPDRNRETPLHFAASFSNTEGVAWLLEHGADVGALDIENRTPLHAASYHCLLGGGPVELLIQHGADVHSTDNNGWLPLHFAAAQGSFAAYRSLVLNGSDVTAVDKKGRTALHLAAASKLRPELAAFLMRHGSDINARDFSGQTVFGARGLGLHISPRWNFLQEYLDNGGDIHAVDIPTGLTTLHYAAACDFVSTLDCLLNQGLDTEARDGNGDTPVHLAASRGKTEMIQRLVQKGADMSAVNSKGLTPLLACFTDINYRGRGSECLLNYGSNVQEADYHGNTAVHFAVYGPRLLKMIIEKGGNVNAVNVHGCTPLH